MSCHLQALFLVMVLGPAVCPSQRCCFLRGGGGRPIWEFGTGVETYAEKEVIQGFMAEGSKPASIAPC